METTTCITPKKEFSEFFDIKKYSIESSNQVIVKTYRIDSQKIRVREK